MPRLDAQVRALQELRKIEARRGDDPESDHIDADNVLVTLVKDLGCDPAIVTTYERLEKWYA